MNNKKIIMYKLQMASDILKSDEIIDSYSMYPNNIETIFKIVEELEIKIPMIKNFYKEEFSIKDDLWGISLKAKKFLKYKYSLLIREEKINEIL